MAIREGFKGISVTTECHRKIRKIARESHLKYSDVIEGIMDSTIMTKLDSVECNCEEKAAQFFHEKTYIHNDHHWWICPAHGYKKL